MITRQINRDDSNRAIITHIYPATGEFVCTIQQVEDEVVIWQEDNIVFPPDSFELTADELTHLGVKEENENIN